MDNCQPLLLLIKCRLQSNYFRFGNILLYVPDQIYIIITCIVYSWLPVHVGTFYLLAALCWRWSMAASTSMKLEFYDLLLELLFSSSFNNLVCKIWLNLVKYKFVLTWFQHSSAKEFFFLNNNIHELFHGYCKLPIKWNWSRLDPH